MKPYVLRIFIRDSHSSLPVPNNRSILHHPVLVAGNALEGSLGLLSIIGLAFTVMTFGWTFALLGSLLYTIFVTVVAFSSAYNLA